MGRRRQTWSQFDEITIIALTASTASAEGDVIDTFRVADMTTMTAAAEAGNENKAEMICQGLASASGSNGQAQFYSLCDDGKDKIACVILRCYMMPCMALASGLTCDQTDHSSIGLG